MPNLSDFAARMQRVVLKFDHQREAMRIRAALAVDQTLVLATPVDTGRARSNWQVSVGHPILTEIEPYAPGNKLGAGEGANAAAALDQAREALVGGLGPDGDASIYITNNVGYIEELNRGHSSQAPEGGFIEKALQDGLAVVQTTRLTD